MSRKPLRHDLPIAIRGGLEEVSTPHAGVAGLIELGRQSNVMAAAEKYLPAKQSPKGLGQGHMVEAFVVLSALGGECLDDFTHLRGDAGLATLLGYTLPAAATARQWLDRFHEEVLLADRPVQGSFIPAESRGLAGLGAVVEHSVRTYVSGIQPGPQVTLDVDAHLVESSKAEALMTYQGFRGYSPEASGVGGDRAGAGRRVSRWECARLGGHQGAGGASLREPAVPGRGLAGGGAVGQCGL